MYVTIPDFGGPSKIRCNIVGLGASRIGINTFFKSQYYGHITSPKQVTRKHGHVEKLEIFNFCMKSAVQECDFHLYKIFGFDDLLDNSKVVDHIVDLVMDGHNKWLKLPLHEMSEEAANLADERIHCFMYFIEANKIKLIDREVIQKLNGLVKMVLVITKSEGMSFAEREAFLLELNKMAMTLRKSGACAYPLTFEFNEPDIEFLDDKDEDDDDDGVTHGSAKAPSANAASASPASASSEPTARIPLHHATTTATTAFPNIVEILEHPVPLREFAPIPVESFSSAADKSWDRLDADPCLTGNVSPSSLIGLEGTVRNSNDILHNSSEHFLTPTALNSGAVECKEEEEEEEEEEDEPVQDSHHEFEQPEYIEGDLSASNYSAYSAVARLPKARNFFAVTSSITGFRGRINIYDENKSDFRRLQRLLLESGNITKFISQTREISNRIAKERRTASVFTKLRMLLMMKGHGADGFDQRSADKMVFVCAMILLFIARFFFSSFE